MPQRFTTYTHSRTHSLRDTYTQLKLYGLHLIMQWWVSIWRVSIIPKKPCNSCAGHLSWPATFHTRTFPNRRACYAWVDHWCKQIVYIVQCMWLLHISIYASYTFISCGMLACSACMWQVFSSLSEPVGFGLKVKWLQARLENYYYDLKFVTALNAFESTIEQSANDKATHTHTPYSIW